MLVSILGLEGAAASDLSKLAWLAGCWASDGGEAGSGEVWMAPAGGALFGMSRTVKGDQTVFFEFLQIRTGDQGQIAFVAQPKGEAPTEFPLVRLSDTEVAFENPGHDFPQRVIYERVGPDKLRARIEGTVGGEVRVVPFPMTRTSCEARGGGREP